MVNLMDYLILSSVVFLLGMMGLVINRKNLILLFMCVELMLLAVNINFVAIAHFLHVMVGELFVFFILTVAAAEAAIGLAILVLIYRARGDINIDQMDTLKG